jgi:hypothetical protein
MIINYKTTPLCDILKAAEEGPIKRCNDDTTFIDMCECLDRIDDSYKIQPQLMRRELGDLENWLNHQIIYYIAESSIARKNKGLEES